MNGPIPEYIILKATCLEALEAEINRYLKDNWQPVGQIAWHEKQEFFYRDMIRFPQPQTEPALASDDEFYQKLSSMDPYVKDMLDINKISLISQDGRLFISNDGKIVEGITPMQVINILKTAKHCPINLDEQKVIDAIGGLL